MEFLYFLTQFRTPITERIAQYITYFGQETLLIVLVAIIFWCINKEVGYKVGFTFCFAGMIVQGLKIAFRIPRPWVLDPHFEPVASAVPAATGYSFPSGHTQGAASILGCIGYQLKNRVQKILCYSIVVLVAFSRMFLGVHTPKDVIAALIVSIAAIMIVERFSNYMPITLFVMAFVVFVFGDIMYRMNIVEIKYVIDCAKVAGATLGFVVGYYFEQKYVQFHVKALWYQQMLKTVIGLLLLVGLKVSLKAIMGQGIVMSGMQQFLMILFVTFFYPMFFTAILKKQKK